MRALLPAAVLALFGGWCGTFYYGASAPAVVVGHLLLLGAAAWAWRGWDPLRLGPRAKAVAPLMWLWLVLAMRASPVPRAGWLAVALLPAFLALPAAVARCWETAEERRRGALAVTVVAGATGAIALIAAAAQGSPRAAQPLGNAVVLGAFLATVVPLALVAAVNEKSRWRWAAAAALVVALVGLLATRSVAALAGLIAGAAVALPRGRRRWLLAPLLAGLVLLGPRLLRIAAGRDSSLHARTSYWSGGLRGVAARPLAGWGPGATAWTLAPHVVPRPGVNPPGEIVADLHCVPLQLAYELGLPGLGVAAVLAAGFVLARRREVVAPGAEQLRRGGLGGLAAGATALAAGPTLGTTAPWVALAIAAGAALASGEPAAPAAPRPHRGPPVGWLYGAIALLLLAPLDAALACYDAARRAPAAKARSWIALAVELDPEMPLYRARLGWLSADAERRRRELARAAAGAPGVAALQLAAGWSAQVAGQGGESYLARACDADPLLGVAPFLLAFARPESPQASRLAARAVLADPPLLAAIDFERHLELRANAHADPRRLAVIDFEGPTQLRGAVLDEVARWEGVDAGLRRAIIDAGSALTRRRDTPIGRRGIAMDADPTSATSLFAFRRLPWPQTLGFVEVRLPEAQMLSRLSGAGWLRTTRVGAFPQPCLAPASGSR